MIKRVNKIKNLGLVFSDYTCDPNLQDFSKFNIFYGWNGSGKTTFTRLLSLVGEVSAQGVEYEIQDNNGTKYKQGEEFPEKIRVFNQDYIDNNIKILEGTANSISILLGEGSKETMEKINADKKVLDGDPESPNVLGMIPLVQNIEKDITKKSKEKDSVFTEIAKTIGAAIGGSALRDYRKPQAEKDYSSIEKVELEEDELQKHLSLVKQESLPVIESLEVKKVNDNEGALVSGTMLLNSLIEKGCELLGKTVESETIPRLLENKDISEWVEQGKVLHEKHNSDTCEYCLQKVSLSRLEMLTKHFNEADKRIKSDIDDLVDDLKKVYATVSNLRLPDKSRFYESLRSEVGEYDQLFEDAKKVLLEEIQKFAEEMKDKKGKTTEQVDLTAQPNSSDFLFYMDRIDTIVSKHNQMTAEFDEIKESSKNKIKSHYFSTVSDNVNEYEKELEELKMIDAILGAKVKEISSRISDNMAKISSDHKACDKINEKLKTFLGHEELSFVPDEKDGEVIGYKIMRGEHLAKRLSEGEKTAIGFVYFIVHLEDENFNVEEGIVVIDDPISSLDSNSLYQAFSFLKNSVKECKQVFVLTHNFEFLKLLINWRRRGGGAKHYMIKNHFPDNVRCAYLDKMDRELCEFESEYHYLFKLLKEMYDEQDDSIAKAYPVSNIARKVWDTFLTFSVPDGNSNMYGKMDRLKEEGYDAQKLDAIYKFTNDTSHITGTGFNPALVPETKKVVGELFEMMEKISPKHFEIINTATN